MLKILKFNEIQLKVHQFIFVPQRVSCFMFSSLQFYNTNQVQPHTTLNQINETV